MTQYNLHAANKIFHDRVDFSNFVSVTLFKWKAHHHPHLYQCPSDVLG